MEPAVGVNAVDVEVAVAVASKDPEFDGAGIAVAFETPASKGTEALTRLTSRVTRSVQPNVPS